MYALVEDGIVIRKSGTLPSNYKHVSNFPSLSEEERNVFGWYFVADGEMPIPGENEYIVEGPYEEYLPGKWKKTWIVKQVEIVVPESVLPSQAKKALYNNGYLNTVINAIDLMEEPYRTLAKIEWESALEFRRDSHFINVIGKDILGLTDQQIDDLFIEAETII